MQDQLLYNDALGRNMTSERTIHTLPIDIRQSDAAFEIEASVPGFKPEDIEITFDENVLTIRGVRQENEVSRGAYVRRERQPSFCVPADRSSCRGQGRTNLRRLPGRDPHRDGPQGAAGTAQAHRSEDEH